MLNTDHSGRCSSRGDDYCYEVQTWEQLYAMFPYYRFKTENRAEWERRGETPHMAAGFARAYEQYMADPIRYDNPNPQSDDDLIGARARIFAEVYLGEWLSVDDGIYQRRFDEIDLLIRQCNGNVSNDIWLRYLAASIAVFGGNWEPPIPFLAPDGKGNGGGSKGGGTHSDYGLDESDLLYHYTDATGIQQISDSGVIQANQRNQVFMTTDKIRPDEALNTLFAGNPFYEGKGDFVVKFRIRPDVELYGGTQPNELIHYGSLRNGRQIEIVYTGPNTFK